MRQLESKKLKYIAGLAKNRKVIFPKEPLEEKVEIRLDELVGFLEFQTLTAIQLEVEVPQTVWVATVEVEISALSGTGTIAIVMNAATRLRTLT